MRALCTLVALLLFSLSYAGAQVPLSERNALVALYDSAAGASWPETTNWLGAAGTECAWFGISCAGGHVTEINLRNSDLAYIVRVGNIPAELGDLTELTKLDFSEYHIGGTIPAELGDLVSLKELDLSGNNLTGSIPVELGNLIDLEKLSLAGNRLSGSIPAVLGNLSELTFLYLSRNALVGEIPPDLGSLSRLRTLTLGSNHLSGSIPPELGHLYDLESLALGRNRLSGQIPGELGQLSFLKSLQLRGNQLTGSIPPELGNLSGLLQLYLEGNQLGGTIPPELARLSNLLLLNLAANKLRGAIPAELGNLTQLTSLRLSWNRLEGNIPPELGDLSQLGHLNLSSNKLSGSIPPELANLSRLDGLRLGNNRLSGAIPPELGNLSNIIELSLYSNQLSGEVPPELADLSRLAYWGLKIGYNALWTHYAPLRAILDEADSDWEKTQTIAPRNLRVVTHGDRTVWLEWEPIQYSADRGGYEVSSESVPTEIISSGCTADKKASTFPVTGLEPGHQYSLTVATFTRPHANNWNTVSSMQSGQVQANTNNTGCAAPMVRVSGNNAPYVMTVTSVHDSYEWSTGEETSSITVRPTRETWYWVKTSGPGFCQEAAVVKLTPNVHPD